MESKTPFHANVIAFENRVLKLDLIVKDGRNRVAIDQSETIHNVRLIPPCIIGKNATIENCTIGPNVTIGDNCTLKHVTIMDCIMWDNKEIVHSHIEGQVIASC